MYLRSFEGSSHVSNIRRKSLSPSVIVIGSGFAGLAAAHALQNASFKVLYYSFLNIISERIDQKKYGSAVALK